MIIRSSIRITTLIFIVTSDYILQPMYPSTQASMELHVCVINVEMNGVAIIYQFDYLLSTKLMDNFIRINYLSHCLRIVVFKAQIFYRFVNKFRIFTFFAICLILNTLFYSDAQRNSFISIHMSVHDSNLIEIFKIGAYQVIGLRFQPLQHF